MQVISRGTERKNRFGKIDAPTYAAMEGPAQAGCEAMEAKAGTPERR